MVSFIVGVLVGLALFGVIYAFRGKEVKALQAARWVAEQRTREAESKVRAAKSQLVAAVDKEASALLADVKHVTSWL